MRIRKAQPVKNADDRGDINMVLPTETDNIINETNAIFDEIEAAEVAAQPSADKPEVIVNGVNIGYNIDVMYNAICSDNEPPLVYQRAGRLVRTIVGKNTINIDEYTPDSIREVVDGIVSFRSSKMVKHKANPAQGTEAYEEMVTTPTPPPIDMLRSLLVRPYFPDIPELECVTDCPVMNVDGSISLCEGYNPETKIYYRPQTDMVIPNVPDTPTNADIIAANKLLNETICDFPFVPGASRTNLIGIIITSVIRPMISGCVPICLIDKPQAGTGASLLSETISIIATGNGAVIRVAPGKDDEWRKLITSIVSEGKLISLIDNVEDKVDLPSLAGAVTSRVWSDRKLQQSKIITYDHRLLWILNGNNVRLGGDLPRRCIWVRMNANLERPWLRPENVFKHNQMIWVREQRGNILCAIYTIVRGWIQAGRPAPSSLTPMMGGFEEWRTTIGGILQYIGYTDFLKNNEEMLNEVDDDAPDWSYFFKTVYDTFNAEYKNKQGNFGNKADLESVSFTTGEIEDIIEKQRDSNNVCMGVSKLQDALPAELNDAYTSKQGFNRKFGRKMTQMKDRIFECGMKITKSKHKTDNKTQWVLTKI